MSDLTNVEYTHSGRGDTYLSEQDHQHSYQDITPNPKFWNVTTYEMMETAYTLQPLDCRGVVLETTSDSAVTLTIDPTLFAVGDCGEICQKGQGQVTIVAGGGGTLQSLNSLVSCAGLYGTLGWRICAGNIIMLTGNLA